MRKGSGKRIWERDLGKGSGKETVEKTARKRSLSSISFPDLFPRSLSPIPFLILLFLLIPAKSLAHKEMKFVAEFGGKGEVEGKFGENTRLAFDKDGNIYIVDTDDRSLQKLDSSGKPLLKIQNPQEKPEYALIRPFDITVSQKGEIFVTDWKFNYVPDTKEPKVYNYGVCVHKFSPEGKFLKTFALDTLAQILKHKDEASPGLDEDGNFALIVIVGKLSRPVYITVDPQDNIYLLDQDKIYKLNSNGELVKSFSQHGSGDGQLDDASDIESDSEGNIYVADKGNHRVVKFNSDGEFLKNLGKMGEEDGELRSPELIAVSSNPNSILVADQAKYRKFVDLPLPARQNDPSVERAFPIGEAEIDPLIAPISPYRRTRTVIRRIQKFSLDAKFEGKYLIRLDVNDPKMRDLRIKAVDADGNVYLVDTKRQTYQKYAPASPFSLSKLQKIVTLRYEIDRFQLDLDNPDDLDDINRITDDYIEKEKGRAGFVRFELAHDLNEDVRLSLSDWATYFKRDVTSLYPGEQRDYRGFPQDDVSLDKYLADFIMLNADLVLEHNTFKYREAGLFIYFGRAKFDFTVDAISPQNLRFLKMKLWANQWGGGLRYDVGRTLRFIFEIDYGPSAGFFNYDYTYHDESGILYATGFRQGKATSVIFALDGVF